MKTLFFPCIPAVLMSSVCNAATLINNGDFENWPGANPVGWVPTSNATATKIAGFGGGNAIQIGLESANTDAHIKSTLVSPLGPNTAFSFSIDFTQSAVTAATRGFNVTVRNNNSSLLNFAVIGNRLNSVGPGNTFGEVSTYNLSADTWHRLVVTGNLTTGGSYSLELYDLAASTSNPVVFLGSSTRWQIPPDASATISEIRLERGRSGYDWSADNISLVPEPSSLLLAGTGILGLAAGRRRSSVIGSAS